MQNRSFKIAVPQKGNLYGLIGLMLILLNLFAFAYAYFAPPQKELSPLLGLLLATASLLAYFFIKHKPVVHLTLLLFTGLCWFFSKEFFLGFLTIATALLGIWTARQTHIVIGEEGIVLPGILPQKISWTALKTYVIKFGLLSFETSDGRLMQLDLHQENAAFSMADLEAFLNEKLG